MAFDLNNIVPWGRSYEEYIDMFRLTDADLSKRILGCGDGPASFNAHLTHSGGSVISADPLYACTVDEIRTRIDETFQEVMHQVNTNRHEFVWSRISDADELGRMRMDAMKVFLEDFEAGKAEQRYLPQALPELDFPDDAFDLCVCSHFLFLYSRQLDMAFHQAAISELCRVAGKVRIFPLLQLGTKPSPYVEPICRHFTEAGYETSIIEVSYEFQRGGNQMLQIKRGRSK